MKIESRRVLGAVSLFAFALATGCAGENQSSPPGGQAGSTPGNGGAATGGASVGTGGTSGPTMGGVSSSGGSTATTGGTSVAGSGGSGKAGAGSGGAAGSTPTAGQGGSLGGASATGGLPSGGASQGGMSSGGVSTGGTPAGGTSGGGAGGGGSGGALGGTGGSGACQKGQVAGDEVLLIGDSFIALNRSITNELVRLGRAAGTLAENEDYQDRSVSGTTLANNQIPGQYTSAVNQGPIKVVLMDGGGNDCLQNNDGDAAVAAATSLFQAMQENDTEYVVYFFYPDPQGSLGAGSLKTCLDGARPQMKSLCESQTSPQCFFIDLRPVFEGHYDEYILTDGIHPTTEGGNAVGQAVWAVMQENCIAQ